MSVNVKYIPNVLNNEGRLSKELEYNREKTIQDYIEESSYKFDSEHRIISSGIKVDGLSYNLNDGDEIIIVPNIKLEAIGAILYAVFWTYLPVTLAVLSLAWSFLSSPAQPSYGSITDRGSIEEASATYGWDGVNTTMNVGTPVPVIYGEHLIGGNIVNAWIRTDGDKNYLNVLLALGEGEIESIDSFTINDNLSTNFDGITSTQRFGLTDQSVIPNFEDSHNLYSVGAEMTKNNPHVYTTVDSDVEGFQIYITLANGLYQQDSTGTIMDWAVTYQVEYKLHSSPSYIDLGSTTITGTSRTAIRRIFRKTGLAAGKYDVRVTKTSDDSSLSPTKVGDMTWVQIDEIKTDDFRYPNTSLLGIEALASEQLSGSTPRFGVMVHGKKVSVPKIMCSGVEVDWIDYYYDPVTEQYLKFIDDSVCSWDGVSYVSRWSANPIWCIRDLLTNTRYGLGQYINTSILDADLMLSMSQYCEEKVPDGNGGFEKRFRLDIVLDSSTKAPDCINQICSSFRGLPFYSGGSILLKINKPELPVQLFTMGNIVQGSFQQSWKSIKEVPNIIEVQYLNKDDNYEQDVCTYEDTASLAAGDPERTKSVRVFTTSVSQAIREARYALKSAKYINRTVSFKAFIDSIACMPGDVISISHDVPQWGFSGRAREGGQASRIVLDREITILATSSYVVRIQYNIDDSVEERIVTNPAGTYNYLDVSVPFTNIPAVYDKYAFGTTTTCKKDFRVISMKKTKEAEVEISAIEYNVLIYDDTAVILPVAISSSLSLDIPPVEDLLIEETVITPKSGDIESTIDVYFTKPVTTDYQLRRYSKARIYLSDSAGLNYIYRGETVNEFFKIQGGLSVGIPYRVLVTSVSEMGEELDKISSPYDDITLVGKDSAPANISNFTYTFTNELVFKWDKNIETDLGGYEIRTEDTNWGVKNSYLVYHGNADTFTIVTPSSRTPGTHYIRAFDTSGNYSSISASVTPTLAAPDVPILSSTIWFGMATLDWADDTSVAIKYYEVWKSETDAWAGEELLYKKVSGSQANLQGKVSVSATADASDATSITDATLIGSGVNMFVKDYIRQTSGTFKNQVAIVTAFDNTTGKVSVASWPSGAPTIGDDFTITDRAFFKVRGVDTYGPGTFSASKAVSFDPLSEFLLEDGSVTTEKLADEAVTADKLYTGEIITLTAQIRDAIITDAKIFDLSADKITAGTITVKVDIGTAGKVYIDGANEVIKIYDDDGDLRVEIGKLV